MGEALRRDYGTSGQQLRRDERLCEHADYLKCYRQGRKRYGSLAVLHFRSNESNLPRLGITASRKVGHAVVRNRTKRRIREIFRRWPARGGLREIDLVVHLKPEAGKATFAALKADIESLLLQLPAKASATLAHSAGAQP
jgi:ribonuclease P protein component